MPILEILKQTVRALWEQKLRSFLTMFGIAWGIASVILLVGLGIGFSADQRRQMRTIGTDIAIVWGGKTGAQAGGYAAGRDIHLTIDDARAVQRDCSLIKTVSPELTRDVAQVSAFNAANRAVRGVWPEYQRFRSLVVSDGRLMNAADEENGYRVVILGAESKEQLFPGAMRAVGQQLQMQGRPYTVIGVLAKKQQNGSYGSGPDNSQLFVPYSSMARDFPPEDKPGVIKGGINNLVIEPVSPEKHEEAIKQLYRELGERHRFEPTDKDALFIWDTLEGAMLVERIFDVMTIFFGAVALLTLSLGGIGVMNIMLVAVTERTREIGVRKALGATARDIQRQFLAESATITLMSGALGYGAGVGIVLLMKLLPLPPFVPHPVISVAAVTLSLLTLSVITLTAGTYPARRAAALSPIECLRSE